MSYVYIRTETNLWTVGHYNPDGKFIPESDHGIREEAAARAHYMNGGRSPDESTQWQEGMKALQQAMKNAGFWP